jgi:hypothetical protein
MGKKTHNNFGNNQNQKNMHQKTNQRASIPHHNNNKNKPIERENTVTSKVNERKIINVPTFNKEVEQKSANSFEKSALGTNFKKTIIPKT